MIVTRCEILRTMPRTEGASSSSRVRFILFRPRPLRVAVCTAGRRAAEATCLTTMVFFAVMIRPPRLQRRACLGSLPPSFHRVPRPGGGGGREDYVVGVLGADGLCHHILQAQHFEHSAHRTTGDDAGARDSGAHHEFTGAMTAFHVVVQRTGVFQRHADKLALGLLGRLADRFRNFLGFALAEADATALVAHNHQSCKAKALAAFYGFGHAVDRHQTVCEFRSFFRTEETTVAATLATVITTVFTFCHFSTPQNFSPPSRAASAKALILP